MGDPVVTHVSGGKLAIPTVTPSHQPYMPVLLHQTKYWDGDSSEDKLMYSERQVRNVPHLATNRPKNEESFVYDRNGVGASVYRNSNAGSYVLPPLPHQGFQPGQLANPHTDFPSCKKYIPFENAAPFDHCVVG